MPGHHSGKAQQRMNKPIHKDINHHYLLLQPLEEYQEHEQVTIMKDLEESRGELVTEIHSCSKARFQEI